LEWPALDGRLAPLDGVDLSPDRLRGEAERAGGSPAWWDGERQAANLRRADLRGASLRHAQLPRAVLEQAALADADLAGARLAGADLSGADLAGALLEDADLHHAVLRFCRGRGSVFEEANLSGADLWGAALPGAELSGADLQGATLEEADLRGATLAGADLRGAVLRRANLAGADLRGADLRGAALGATDLAGAVLRDARLDELDLLGCRLTHVHAAGARLERTRLEREQLGGASGEELKGDYGAARKGYLALERNFEDLGDHDAARWAYRRRRRMEKWEALAQAKASLRERRWAAARPAAKFAADQLVEWVCDYGESVSRVLATLLVVFVGFTAAYGLTGAVLRVDPAPNGPNRTPTFAPADLALFSMTAMTSPGNPPDYLVPRDEIAYLIAGVQTGLSIFLTGLMGFVAGNRIRR
jgi:uncharacterized protein YjbI with pentapeptide repeats